mgnify:CR=1 FL=1
MTENSTQASNTAGPSQSRDDSIAVLHVDDDSALVELSAELLERESDRITVHTETRPSDALDYLTTETVDCIISDYDMPGLDGLELLDEVREEYPDLPFILFTGKGSEEIASEAIARGVTDYLQKGTGTEQYELLTNRLVNAVQQYRAKRRAATLDRIRKVLRDVNQALIRVETREEIERQVCELISEAEPYRFVWIGEHDSDSQIVEPRTATGIEDGYLDAIEITTDDSTTGLGPTGRAVRNREMQVMQNILDDPAFEPWRDAALERGYRSSAAVPLLYDGTLYGVLNVYAERTYAFDEQERELLTELAGDIAHAIYRSDVQDRQRRYERIIENLPVGICRAAAGSEGELIEANPALAAIVGAADTDELLEHSVSDFIRDSSEAETFVQKIRDEGVVRDEQFHIETLTGEHIWISVTAIQTEEDDDLYFDGIVQDITQRKCREEKLRQTTARLEALFENSPDMINVHDTEGQILDANRQLCEQTGYDEAELTSMNVWDLDQQIDSDEARAIWTEMDVGDLRRIESEYRRKDGSTFPVEVHLRRLDLDGTDRFLVMSRNISEQKEREEELLRQNERLEQFTSTVSHDLRNPLEVAAGRVELAREECDSPHLDDTERALGRIEQMIDDVLTLSREGTQVTEFESVALSGVVEACWEAVPAEKATVRIQADRTIRADRNRLRRLFENLLQNAIDHGGTDVTITVGDLDDGFYVADNGAGLARAERERLFERGYTTVDGRTGFGLAIVHEIVDAHDWTITVTESEDGGARFEVTDVVVERE